jgi:hypothetical protein
MEVKNMLPNQYGELIEFNFERPKSMMTNSKTILNIIEERIDRLKSMGEADPILFRLQEAEYIYMILKEHEAKEKEKLAYLYDY